MSSVWQSRVGKTFRNLGEMDAAALFEEAIAWLKDNYDELGFHMERDVVWTLQTYLVKTIKERGLPFRVFSGYRVIPEIRKSADLVIVNQRNEVEIAAEFKYEASHRREDIQPQKFPMVFWGTAPSEVGEGVAHDVERIRQFVESGKAKVGYAIFLDEGGYFRHREPIPGSRWIDWETKTSEGHSVSILWARWPSVPLA